MVAPLSEVAALIAITVTLDLLTADAAGWSVEDRRALLAGLDRVVDTLVTVRAAVLVAERQCGTWQGAGDRSFPAWRARTAGTGHRSAATQVRQAEQLDAVPGIAAAVTAGRIGLEQATILAKVAATGTPAQRAALEDPATLEELLGLAERQDADAFATTTARFAASVDPAGLERDHQAQRRERFVHLTETAQGTYLKGRLDTIAGHRLRLALESLTPRPAADDDRDPGQRCADALAEMARRTLSTDTKPGAHVPPQITMIVPAETWAAARAERDHRRALARARAEYESGSASGSLADGAGATDASGTGGSETSGTDASEASGPSGTEASGTKPSGTDARGTSGTEASGTKPSGIDARGTSGTEASGVSRDGSEPVAGYPPATLEDGTCVPASELAAAMCDCAITRVVIDADGVPIDLGRTQRLFTGEQRRAIVARDRECVWPTCHMPARWCEIHHLAWWERDKGPTSVDNGAPFCGFHHHEVHRRDLAVTRVALPTSGPPGRRRGRPPRRPQGTLALVAYEFRNPTGRLIIEPEGATAGPVAIAHDHHDRGGPKPGRAEVLAQPTPATDASPQRSNRAQADELDLTWTTDPVTGMRVPTFFMDL